MPIPWYLRCRLGLPPENWPPPPPPPTPEEAKALFLNSVKVEYPIPWHISIWGIPDTPYQQEIVDFWDMVNVCTVELRSDLDMSENIVMYGPNMQLPPGTLSVAFAKLYMAFPGNRMVKADYDTNTRMASVRYYPAELTVRRELTLRDVVTGKLQGDALIYFRCYLLWKLASKERQVLSAITLDTDNAALNLETLGAFADEKYKRYEELKQGILIYGAYTY
jgi:hypothetical protein